MKSNKYYSVFGICLVCLSVASNAQTSGLENSTEKTAVTDESSKKNFNGMRELVLLVLQNHPDLSQAESESRMAVSRVREARSGIYPHSNRTSTFNDQVQAQLKLTQPLYDPSLGPNVRRLKAGSLGYDWQLVTTREQLILRTVEFYIEVIRQHQLTELARQNLKLHRNYVAQMKDIARTDIGRASDLSVAQARVALAESTFTSRMAKLESARLQWRNHSGMNSPDLSTLANLDQLITELGNVPLPQTLDQAISEALNNSPQLQKSLSEVKTNVHNLEISRSVTKPKINAEAVTRTGQNYGFVLGRQDDISVGVNLQWVLPLNPGYKYSNRAAREAIQASESAVDSTTYKVRTAVESQWFELLANQASLETFQAYVESSQQVVAAYSEQFKIGRRSLLDVLNAENELFTARTNAMTAISDTSLTSWRLLSLRGYLADYLEL
ncbi:MAG: hypothetical protein EBU92_04675 [Betaproteobacteria bacterium]|nr:hypothetical protein [Betaproteobacteria bacterium]